MPSPKHIYKIRFINEGKVYEIYARRVCQGQLYGFVEVEELVFGERTAVVVDPAEERLKAEFAGVKRSHIPMHAIIRIDEVEKGGTAKIHALPGGRKEAVTPFPMPAYVPGKDGDN
ncbi:MAG TPA: DUF1820 family protein [Gammaproteobacteria bacterium]|nr:DUF1820 family protein [Gammaproteobacteria bacterium]